MTDVKICGVCRPPDARLAARAGAAYVGVILAPGFARTRDGAAAAAIFASATDAGGDSPPGAGGRASGSGRRGPRRVGVFVDAPLAVLVETATLLDLDVLQLHGRETPAAAAAADRAGPWEVWKVLRPRSGTELRAGFEAFGGVVGGVLLDGWNPRIAGGTGTRLPWRELEAARQASPPGVRVIVAGGLTPENVAEAVRRLRPDVVDVSSGVERAPGEKSSDAVRRFIAAAREAGAPGVA